MTLLRKRETRKQLSRSRPSDRVYPLLYRTWQLLLCSVGIDFVLPVVPRPPLSLDTAVIIALGFCMVIAPFLSQRRAHELLSMLRGANKRSLAKSASFTGLAIAGLATFIVSSKLLFTLNLTGAAFAAVLVAGAYLVYRTIAQVSSEIQIDREKLLANPRLQIARWEEQLFIFLLLPLLAARSLSICGILAEGATIMDRLIFSVTCIVFLMLLRPQQSLFKSLCSRCKQPVPVILASMGRCHRCDEKIRERFASED